MNCKPENLLLDNAITAGGETRGNALTLHISEAIVTGKRGDTSPGDKSPGDKLPGDKLPGDKLPDDTVFEHTNLTLENFRLTGVFLETRRVLAVKTNTPKEIKGRRLYKSELEEFTSRLFSEEWDFLSFEIGENSHGKSVSFMLSFSSDGGLFTVNISCTDIIAECIGEGRKIPREKSSFLEKFSKIFSKSKEKHKNIK